ncbi:Sulphatase-modifying factor domain protein, partial [Candidatus Magnetomorum sp. HK-1]
VIMPCIAAELRQYKDQDGKTKTLKGLDYTKYIFKFKRQGSTSIKTEKEKAISKSLATQIFINDIDEVLLSRSDAFTIDFLEEVKQLSIVLDYLEKIINLNKSIPSFDQGEAVKYSKLLIIELYKAGASSFKEYQAEIIFSAIKSVTPAKAIALVSSVGKGSMMAYDAITKPSVIPINISRDDNNKLTFSIPIPEDILSVRYLKVDNDNINRVVDIFNLEQKPNKSYKNDKYNYYMTSISPDDNHWLVMSGFEASVENHAIYKPNDATTINELCKQNAVIAKWHSYRFKNMGGFLENLPRRIKENAFLGETNFFEKVVKNTGHYEINHGNPVLDTFMDNFSDYVDEPWFMGYDDLYYLDFTKTFGSGLLKHITPGIYSDFTNFLLNKDDDKKEYHNTFNMYVLPNYIAKNEEGLNEAIQKQSSYQSSENFTVLTLKLSYPEDKSFWGTEAMPDELKYKGMKYYPYYVIMRYYDNKNNMHWTRPQEISFENSKYSIYLPAIDYNRGAVVYVYDYILHHYIQKTGKSMIAFLDKQAIVNLEYLPFMAFNLKNIERVQLKIETQTDSDGDGVIDSVDIWPNNKLYAIDSDQDQMPDSWEMKYGLDYLVKNETDDDDKDGYTNLQEFEKTLEIQDLDENLSGYNPILAAPKFRYAETIFSNIAIDCTKVYSLESDLGVEWSGNLNDLIIYNDEPMKYFTLNQSNGELHVISKGNPLVDESETITISVITKDGERSQNSLTISLKFKERLIPPVNLKAVAYDDGIDLTWSRVEGTDKYYIYVAETALVDSNNYSQYFVSTTNSFKLDNPNGTAFYVAITSFNEIQESDISEVISYDNILFDQAPKADFTYKTNGLMLTLHDTSTGNNQIYSRIWDFGDNSYTVTTESTQLSYDYKTYQTYTVSLKVIDDQGLEDIFSREILISENPTIQTFWHAFATDMEAGIQDVYVPITVSQRTYEGESLNQYTAWISQDITNEDYYIQYHLPVPEYHIDLSHKVRLEVLVKESSIAHYSREIAFQTSNHEFSAAFIDQSFEENGFFRVIDLTTSNSQKITVSEFSDNVAQTSDDDLSHYAIEIDGKSVNVYGFKEGEFEKLYTYTEENMGQYLNEILITFKGNGKIVKAALSYHALVDDNFVEKDLVLNTADRMVVWNESTQLETFTNSIGMTFVRIPAGTFIMGSPEDELGRWSDEVLHQVTLTQDFYMQTTEVTQGQWKAIMGNNPSYFSNCGDNCPVEYVSWNDAQEFIQKLNQKEGDTYRLPTEAEWEYAARAGSTTALANGNLVEKDCNLDVNLNAMGWYCGNSNSETHQVAQKQANAWGLYDMHGNVWEWCNDWYD